jgi:hypothetical protein
VGDGSGPTSRWLSNKCVLCRHPAVKLIYQSTWGMLSLPPPTLVHGDLPCAGGVCGNILDEWELRDLYCSEDYRLCQEINFFEWKFEIRDW